MDSTANYTFPVMVPNVAQPGLDGALAAVDQRVMESVLRAEGVVRDMCEHIAASGGKRIRPRLVIGSAMAFGGATGKAVDAAASAEFIHMASLVHDDVIDRSDLRRGKPSVNRKWGDHAAVLCGDWLFAQAFGILSGAGMSECMRFMVDAIQAMCQGELLQASHMYNPEAGIDEYYATIARKTARLLESCCKAGAWSAGADAKGVAALGKYGLNLGMAFQIVDDILDFEGKPGALGKPAGEDLRQGIITLPVILLLQDIQYGSDAKKALSERKYGEDTVSAVRELLNSGGFLGRAYAVAGSFVDNALGSLDTLPESDGKAALSGLAAGLRNRVH